MSETGDHGAVDSGDEHPQTSQLARDKVHKKLSVPTVGSSLDLTGASIHENTAPCIGQATYRMVPAPSIELPNQEPDYVSHIALDIGGSLIKLVYFSPDFSPPSSSGSGSAELGGGNGNGNGRNGIGSARGGRLHFVKFETSRVEDCIAFIEAKGLHRFQGKHGQKGMRVKATGGGAYKLADIFMEKLGVVLEKEDEMACLVSGCNFLLKAIHHEAFTYENATTTFVPTNKETDLYPYLLVNIGSGVSMVKVVGDNEFERVSGSSLGGGTFWGLCRLLTQRQDFDDMLELSMEGDNSSVDMLVGDIYGGRDYGAIGLSASTIASSFGKVIGQDQNLEDYNPADLTVALCRMVSYNIGQLAYLNAMRYNIKRIFFGGFFIRGHPYTMETISYAIRFWSKGEMAAMFLRHEGFLGSVGAFLTVNPMTPLPSKNRGEDGPVETNPGKVRARFVERFSMGAPFAGGKVVGPAISDLSGKVSWVEKFVQAGTGGEPLAEAPSGDTVEGGTSNPCSEAETSGAAAGVSDGGGGGGAGEGGEGVLKDAASEEVCQADASVSRTESLPSPLPPYLRDMTTADAPNMSFRRGGRGSASSSQMALHVGVLHYSPSLEPFPLLADPSSYDPNTLDISQDEEELQWWLKVLDDQVPVLVEKAIASEGGGDLTRRRGMAFGRAFSAHMRKLRAEPGAYGRLGLAQLFEMREECLREFGFTDVYRLDKERENSAALNVLPDLLTELDALPLEERWLALVEGALAANIFDWGARSCVELYQNGTILDIYRSAREKLGRRPWAVDQFDSFKSHLLGPLPVAEGEATKLGQRPWAVDQYDEFKTHLLGAGGPGVSPSHPYRRAMIFVDNSGADIVLGMLPLTRELLRMGCEVVLVANSLPAINDITAPELRTLLSAASQTCAIIGEARDAALKVKHLTGGHIPPRTMRAAHRAPALDNSSSPQTHRLSRSAIEEADSVPGPKLYVIGSGHGSPCVDFHRVPDLVAEACIGTDLLIIEGMGRAVHTNLYTRFHCDTLKVAMIKTERLAKRLFNGNLYDCVCLFEEGSSLRGGMPTEPAQHAD